jgi:hypothetical protein
MRRGSGFNKLFDAVPFKETDAPPQDVQPSALALPLTMPSANAQSDPIAEAAGHRLHARKPAKKQKVQVRTAIVEVPTKAQLAEIVHENAAVEFGKQIQNPSLKWTSGVDLDVNDIRQLFRAANRNYEVPHSAYDVSLPTGDFSGQDSPYPRMPRPAK